MLAGVIYTPRVFRVRYSSNLNCDYTQEISHSVSSTGKQNFEIGSLFREIFIKSKLHIWKTFSVMLPGNELCQEK